MKNGLKYSFSVIRNGKIRSNMAVLILKIEAKKAFTVNILEIVLTQTESRVGHEEAVDEVGAPRCTEIS